MGEKYERVADDLPKQIDCGALKRSLPISQAIYKSNVDKPFDKEFYLNFSRPTPKACCEISSPKALFVYKHRVHSILKPAWNTEG